MARGASSVDDPYPNRLLLEEEYKRKALAWLTGDYHQEIVRDGKTRQQLFLETAPATARVRFDFGDLQTVFAKRETRKVQGNGTVRYQGRQYAMPDAGLIVWQGQQVVLLVNDIFPETVIEVGIQERGGLRLLGRLELMDIAANSVRASQYRRDAKEHMAELKRLSAEVQRQYLQPEMRADIALERTLTATTGSLSTGESFTLTTRLERDPDAVVRQQIADAVTAMQEDNLILDAPVDDLLEGNL
ncbi:MAG: hypothetical protein HC933_00685 [Pleurocapsa sp. SU_196_0]|nr:hypothetical protein [Pleurocapsa sp. SU_196_0]